MICDTADTGDDFCAMPIAAVYGSEVYIVDVVFDDSVPEVTKPECAKALIDNKVVASTFESNNAGKYFARDVQQILTDRKYVCNIRTKQTISNKQTRIEFASDNILKKFYFKDPSLYARNSQYAAFLKQVTIDYVTGLLVAGVFHNSGKTENGALESRAGWKGLCRKCITLLMVLVATRLDLVTGTNFIRDAVVIAFIANETISIVENAGLMGINIPPAITSAIEVLKKKSDSVDNTDQ